ncbi:unnamed protein product [Cercospora beticola]|nr:unnamed protein product [Cercospora beticola]
MIMSICLRFCNDPDCSNDYELPFGTRGYERRQKQSEPIDGPVQGGAHPAPSLAALPQSGDEYFPQTSDPFLSSSTQLRADSDESTAKFTSEDGQHDSSSDAHDPSNDEQAFRAPLPTPATLADARDLIREDEQSEYDDENDDEDGRDGEEDDDQDEEEDEKEDANGY